MTWFSDDEDSLESGRLIEEDLLHDDEEDNDTILCQSRYKQQETVFSELADLSDKLKEKSIEISAFERSLRKEQDAFLNQKASLANSIDLIQTKLQYIYEMDASLKKQNHDLRQRERKLQIENSKLDETIESIVNCKLQLKEKEHDEMVHKLLVENADLKKQIMSLKSDKKRSESFFSQYKHLKVENTELETKLNGASDEIIKLQFSIDTMKRKLKAQAEKFSLQQQDLVIASENKPKNAQVHSSIPPVEVKQSRVTDRPRLREYFTVIAAMIDLITKPESTEHNIQCYSESVFPGILMLLDEPSIIKEKEFLKHTLVLICHGTRYLASDTCVFLLHSQKLLPRYLKKLMGKLAGTAVTEGQLGKDSLFPLIQSGDPGIRSLATVSALYICKMQLFKLDPSALADIFGSLHEILEDTAFQSFMLEHVSCFSLVIQSLLQVSQPTWSGCINECFRILLHLSKRGAFEDKMLIMIASMDNFKIAVRDVLQTFLTELSPVKTNRVIDIASITLLCLQRVSCVSDGKSILKPVLKGTNILESCKRIADNRTFAQVDKESMDFMMMNANAIIETFNYDAKNV